MNVWGAPDGCFYPNVVYPTGRLSLSYCGAWTLKQHSGSGNDWEEAELFAVNIFMSAPEWWITMIATLHEYHGISDHQQLNCLIRSIIRLTTTSKLLIIDPLWGESTPKPSNNVESIYMLSCHHDPCDFCCDDVNPHLTHGGLMMPYDNKNMGQHWFRWWLGACWHFFVVTGEIPHVGDCCPKENYVQSNL